MESLKTIRKSGYTLNIYLDEDARNPRTEWDNLGTLYIPRPPRGCTMTDEGADQYDAEDAPVSLPVYVIDHSCIAISELPFGCPWDSWLAGCIYVKKDVFLKEYGEINDETISKAKDNLRGELAEYGAFISGNVYGFIITRDCDGEELDSCWGFYGDDGLKRIEEDFDEFVAGL